MTWEIVPEQTGPTRSRTGRSGAGRLPWRALCAVGALIAAVGVGLMVLPFRAASWILVALVTLVGVSLIVVGGFWLVLLIRLSERGLGITAIPAVLIALAGVFALVWPSVALSIVSVVAGLCLIALGMSMVWAALALRRATQL